MQQVKQVPHVIAFVLIGLTSWMTASAAAAGLAFDIAAGSATITLKQYASQAHLQLLFDYKAVEKLKTPAVKGQLEPTEALTLLLTGTGLSFHEVNDHTISVVSPGSALAPYQTGAQPSTQFNAQDAGKEGKTDSSGTFRVMAQANAGAPASVSGVDNSGVSASGQTPHLEEIIVTAQKRAENVLEVPLSVSVVTGEQLEAAHVVSLVDLAAYVPNLAIQSSGYAGERTIAIRGFADPGGLAGALVATYIDDVPFGATSNQERGAGFGLDLMPYDIDHIEVLEGPQGTLYGGDSTTGLIKYVLKKPDLNQFSARAGLDVQDIDYSGTVGTTERGAINFPIISGQLGARMSGYYLDNAGWIDNIGTGVSDANRVKEYGGRATVLWQPTDKLSAQLTVLAQNISQAEVSQIALTPGSYRPLYGSQADNTQFPTPLHQQTRDYALAVSYDFDFATLSSSTSWQSLSTGVAADYSIPYGQYVSVGGVAVPNALTLYEPTTEFYKFVEEVRLTSSTRGKLKWLLAGYDTREYGFEDDQWPSFTSARQILPVSAWIYSAAQPVPYNSFTERAGFGNATYSFSPLLDIGAGARYSSYSRSDCTGAGYGILHNPAGPCTIASPVDVTTWMANVSVHPSQDSMIYARASTGYRPGQGCATCITPGFPEIPAIVKPDHMTNYEVGYKADAFGRRLEISATVFYMLWRDMQLSLATPPPNIFGYTGNGGGATSDGVELTVKYRPTDEVSINAAIGRAHAYLTADIPTAPAVAGDPIPGAAPWNGSITFDYHRNLNERFTGLAGLGYRYRDTVQSYYAQSAQGTYALPPQNIADMYLGVQSTQGFLVKLWAKNLFNNSSFETLGFLNNPAEPRYVPVQPRTVGVSVDYNFAGR
jgi:outer membrane receptor protein involved in Fe transport